MTDDAKGFDGDGFYRALEAMVKNRGLTWKAVSDQTGVGASTLTRMSQGKRPDAASLAVLSAWAGLNPSHFVSWMRQMPTEQPLMEISALLHGDPSLDREAAAALDAIVRTAYEKLKKSGTSS
jgi:transcriptional regulator with XRE-family HTH domain